MSNAWIIKPLPLSAVQASGTAAGYSLGNVTNDYAGVVWQSDGAAGPFIILDTGADNSLDTIALFGLAGFPAAQQVTIRVATAAQGPGFGLAGFTTILPSTAVYAGSEMAVSGKGVGLHSIAAPVVARYVLLTWSGLPGAIQISRVVIGKRIQLERNFSFGATFGVRDLGSLDFSRRGVLMRVRGRKLRTVELTFSNINKDEVETTTKPLLEQVGNTEMIVVVTDPDPHAQRQNRCYFGALVGDLGHTQRNARGWEAKINVASIF